MEGRGRRGGNHVHTLRGSRGDHSSVHRRESYLLPLEALHSGNGSRRRVKTSGGHLVLSSFDVAAAGTPIYTET